MVYDPVIQGQRRWFGVSGRLYKRNLLFYDLETDSLWSQLLSRAVTGPLAGTALNSLPAENTTWSAWKTEHPRTLLLSAPASGLNYKEDPYAAYPLRRDPALLVSVRGKSKIFPFAELKKQPNKDPAGLSDRVGGQTITIVYDGLSNSAFVQAEEGSAVVFFEGFFDDLKAFYPEAEIYQPQKK